MKPSEIGTSREELGQGAWGAWARSRPDTSGGCEHLRRRLARVEGEEERNQPAHDVGVAVAAPMQDGLGRGGFDAPLKPNLAGAALNLVGVVVRLRRQGRQHAAEFDEVAIALLPLV